MVNKLIIMQAHLYKISSSSCNNSVLIVPHLFNIANEYEINFAKFSGCKNS